MKLYVLIFILFSILAVAQESAQEDTKDFKNDNFQGKNKLQRINSNASQISKMIGDIASLKAEVETLKKKVKNLSNSKVTDEGFSFDPPAGK